MNGPVEREPQDRAARLVRQHTEQGWVAMREDLLALALRAFRPSAPVRGRHALGDFFVAADVLVDLVRRSVDAEPRAAATDITCRTDEADILGLVTVVVIAAYGAHLLTVAEAVRERALAQLRSVLGGLAPAAGQIQTHVHVGDVTDDPRML